MPGTALSGDMQRSAELFECGFQQVRQSNDRAVVETPDEVVNLRAVPDADDGEHQQVRHSSGQYAAQMLAAVLGCPFAETLHRLGQGEGVKEVVAHPCAEGDMPTPPEIPQ